MSKYWIIHSIGILALSSLVACSSADKIDTSTAEGAYKLAKTYEDDERYEEAITYFKEVKNKHPYSRFATASELAIADIEFKREAFDAAEASYRIFKELHPSHEKSAYVTFRLGLSIFKQLPATIDRDLENANQAIIYFDEVMTSFPDSKYSKDAKKKKRESKKMLAEKAMYIADWYYGQDEWLSAMGRYKDILGQHSKLGFDKRALFGASVAAFRAKELEEANMQLETFKKRFPDSDEYKAALKELKK